MDRPTQVDCQHWQPDSIVLLKSKLVFKVGVSKRQASKAMTAAAVANDFIERMIENEVKRLPK